MSVSESDFYVPNGILTVVGISSATFTSGSAAQIQVGIELDVKGSWDGSQMTAQFVEIDDDDNGGPGSGIHRSDDGGESWELKNGNRILWTRSWYYQHIAADPVDDNIVYVLNAPFMKSIDGGVTFDPDQANQTIVEPGFPLSFAADFAEVEFDAALEVPRQEPVAGFRRRFDVGEMLNLRTLQHTVDCVGQFRVERVGL